MRRAEAFEAVDAQAQAGINDVGRTLRSWQNAGLNFLAGAGLSWAEVRAGGGNLGVPAVTLPPAWTPTPNIVTTPIPGWVRFESKNVELWLPEGFVALSASGEFSQELLSFLETLGPEFESSVQAIREDPSQFPLFVSDPVKGPSGVVTNVMVFREESGLTAEQYMGEVAVGLSPELGRVVRAEMVSLDRYPAGKAVIELFDSSGVAGGLQVNYFIRVGDKIYSITYFTAADEFETRLPTFEQSVQTFVAWP